jgi:peptide subunit release factor 1 (eRF1)
MNLSGSSETQTSSPVESISRAEAVLFGKQNEGYFACTITIKKNKTVKMKEVSYELPYFPISKTNSVCENKF